MKLELPGQPLYHARTCVIGSVLVFQFTPYQLNCKLCLFPRSFTLFLTHCFNGNKKKALYLDFSEGVVNLVALYSASEGISKQGALYGVEIHLWNSSPGKM